MNEIIPVWAQRRGVGLLAAGTTLAVLTALLTHAFDRRQVLDVALLYLLVTLLAAALWGYTIGLAAAVASDLLVNFFFVDPVHTFTVQEPRNVVALLVFLAVAAIGASMLALLRREVTLSRASEAEANILLELNQAIAQADTPDQALQRLCEMVANALGAGGCAIVRRGREWEVSASTPDVASSGALDRDEERLVFEAIRAQAVLTTGRSTTRMHYPPRTFAPFPHEATEHGALRIMGRIVTPPQTDEARLLAAFAAEASTALHHARLAQEARRVADLQRADEFKAVLLSSVSPDLRSPLTAIKAAVGSLRDHGVAWSEEDTAGFLETIEGQADRLAAIVADLLQISRLESGTVRIAIEPIEVGALLDDAAQASAPLIAGRSVHVDAPDALWIAADYGLLMQALGNLLENAAKYSAPGMPIQLAARRTSGSVRLVVHDDGPGISREDLPHIFEKFYRGAQTRESKGTGLGLAIVKAMAELCGGTVTVRSTMRETEFALVLPEAPTPA